MDPSISVQNKNFTGNSKKLCKSFWSPIRSQKSFTLTIPWNSANLVKISPGIIARQHHTDRRLMGLLRAVRRIKEGTSAMLLQSSLDERWWADSMECYCPWTSLICVSSTKCVYMCVRRCPLPPPPKHQMRLYVCHQMRLYVCHQMRLYVCHQMRLYVCHQMRLHVCHQMRLLNPQRSSLRSLTFARFARTFFNSLN